MPETTTLLAFDFGEQRTGVAVGQTITGRASQLTTLQAVAGEPDWDAIDTLINEWRPDLLLVGLPVNADGSDTAQCEAARAFAAELARTGLPVQLLDEHLSSREARTRFVDARASGRRRRRVRKADIDSASAVIIAEQWLNQRDLRRPRETGARIAARERDPAQTEATPDDHTRSHRDD